MKGINMSYNEWSNKETRIVNHYFGDVFSGISHSNFEVSPAELREIVRESFILSKLTAIEREFVTLAMARVDWKELADEYQSEDILVDEM
jgi:phosphoenolpyruvate synthase/pyruvate phosphate dikinase